MLDSIAQIGDSGDPMSYPGGKSGAGVFQTIINLMPPHDVYVEPFLGGAAVMRMKRPASLNIGIDLVDPSELPIQALHRRDERFCPAVSPIPTSSAGAQRQLQRLRPPSAKLPMPDRHAPEAARLLQTRQEQRAGPPCREQRAGPDSNFTRETGSPTLRRSCIPKTRSFIVTRPI